MKKNSQRGEVVIEASIVVTIVAMFLVIIFYVGMLLYQQTALTAAANKTASNVAMLYGNNQKDPFTGYVDSDGVYQNITYSDLKTETYMQDLQKKANAFAAYSLKASDILNTGTPDIKIEIVNKNGELFKKQVVVTITSEFNAPLVGLFSNDTVMKCTAVGRADCVDLLSYINGVDAVSDPESSNVLTFPEIDSCVVTFIDNPDTNNVVAVVPVLKGHSISSAESIKEAHSFWPDNPKIKGIEFTGWADSNGTVFTRNTTVNSNITVYGAWECTITFKPNGGQGNDIQKKVPYGKTLVFPNIQRNNYKISGWYDNEEGTGNPYYSNVTIFKNSCTLYPKWQCTHPKYNSQILITGTCQKRHWCKYTCTTCGYEYEDNGSYGTCAFGEYTINTKASCTTSGVKTAICKYCSSVMPDLSSVTPAKGHLYAKGKSGPFDLPYRYNRPATCYQVGYNGTECSRCGTYEVSEIPMENHKIDSGKITKASTCTASGEKKYECTNSGCSYSYTETIKTISHNKDNVTTTKATCTKDGKTVYKCSMCKKTQKTDIIDKLGHNYSGHCGQKHPVNEYWEKTNKHKTEGHYVEWASCTVCTRCGKRGSYAVLCGTHWEEWKEAGWPGYSYVKCKDCGNKKNKVN